MAFSVSCLSRLSKVAFRLSSYHKVCLSTTSAAFKSLTIQTALAGIPAPYHESKTKNDAGKAEDNKLPDCQVGESGIIRFGEDACFISTPVENRLTFGVADGVGGWRQHGLDSGLVSHGLMANAAYLFHQQEWPEANPQKALDSIYMSLLEQSENKNNEMGEVIVAGSCTALLGEVSNQKLHIANLGDSGLVVISPQGDLKLKTEPQTAMGGVFNCPNQLAVPEKLAKGYPTPKDADLYNVRLELGDIFLAATDGFWDNVYPETIAEVIERWRAGELSRAHEEKLNGLAAYLCHVAYHLASRQDYKSPFEQAALKAGLQHEGGKVDDCTLVLGIVEEVQDS